MSEWIPPGHRPHTEWGMQRLWCACGSWCSPDIPCDCCELAELRAEVERLTGLIDAALAECERHLTDGFVLTWKIERILRCETDE